MAKCKALTGSAVKGLIMLFLLFISHTGHVVFTHYSVGTTLPVCVASANYQTHQHRLSILIAGV